MAGVARLGASLSNNRTHPVVTIDRHGSDGLITHRRVFLDPVPVFA